MLAHHKGLLVVQWLQLDHLVQKECQFNPWLGS